MLFVDAGNDNVGIGTASPQSTLGLEGDISASGIITGEQITSTDDASINDLLNVGRIRGNGNNISEHLNIQTPVNFEGNITASGDISSSVTSTGS